MAGRNPATRARIGEVQDAGGEARTAAEFAMGTLGPKTSAARTNPSVGQHAASPDSRVMDGTHSATMEGHPSDSNPLERSREDAAVRV